MTDIQPHTPDASAVPGRDARLAQALRHMPDAHMQPGSTTRLAVLRAAQEAIATTAPPEKSGRLSGWARWFKSGSAPDHRIPWATAITSVLIVGFVGVLWHDRELPGAIPDGPALAEKKATPTATPAPALPPEAASAVPPEPSPQQSESKLARAKPAAHATLHQEAPSPAFVPPPEAAQAPAPAPIAHDQVSERATESSDARLNRPLRPVPSQATASSGMAGGLRANKADTAVPEKLLQALRALPCAAPALDSPPNNNTPAWVVEGTHGEIWTITPNTVSLRDATGATSLTPTPRRICAISADQYEQLRQLAH